MVESVLAVTDGLDVSASGAGTLSSALRHDVPLRMDVLGRRVPQARLAGGMKDFYDVVIVGGGHNGLVAATYLAQSGLSTLVLEQQAHTGGAAVSQQVFPGVDARLSRYSYLVSLLPDKIAADLGLSLEPPVARGGVVHAGTPFWTRSGPDGRAAGGGGDPCVVRGPDRQRCRRTRRGPPSTAPSAPLPRRSPPHCRTTAVRRRTALTCRLRRSGTSSSNDRSASHRATLRRRHRARRGRDRLGHRHVRVAPRRVD